MSTTVNRQEFVTALTALRSVVSSNSILPVLQNVKLDGQDGTLTLTINNLEMQATRRIPYTGKPLLTTATAKMLADFAANFKGDKLELKVEGNKLRLTSQKRKASVPTIDVEEYPQFKMDEAGDPTTFTIERSDLDAGISRTLPFAVTDPKGAMSRPILACVHIEGSGGIIRFTSADNYRLAESTVDAKVPDFSVNLPAGTAKALSKLLGDGTVTVSVVPGRGASFTAGNTEVLTRLVEGNYPNTSQLFRDASTVNLLVPVGEMEDTLKLATIASEIIVKFELIDDGLRVTSSERDGGDFEASVPVTVGGEAEKVVFALNPKYLAALVGVFGESTQVELGYNATAQPIAFRDPSDDSFRAVIMPVRIPN